MIAESADFQDITKGAGQYTYNRNGAINKDTHRGVSNIRYNSLNLPEEVTVGNIEGSGSIKYSYSGTGTKLSTQHINNTYPARSKTTTYVGNLVYENGALKRVLVEGGYVEGGVHHFFLEDYLGNVRVVANASGDVVQKNAYYPFGMAFAGSPGGAAGGVGASAADQAKQPYKFGGKELDQAFGLDQYDFSARYYDPATARFTSQDPLAEKYYSISPYAYCSNNPIKYIDPSGMNPDWYSLGTDGKIELIKETTKNYDVLFSRNDKGEGNGYKALIVNDKKLLPQLSGDPATKYKRHYGTTSNATDAFNVFKFASDNSNAEWGLNGYATKDGNQYLIRTSYNKEYVRRTDGQFDAGDKVFNIHSHPGTTDPGASDNITYGPPPTNAVYHSKDMGNINSDYNGAIKSGHTSKFPNHYVYTPDVKMLYHYTPWKNPNRSIPIQNAVQMRNSVLNRNYNPR